MELGRQEVWSFSDDRWGGRKGYEPPMQAANPAAAIEHATIELE